MTAIKYHELLDSPLLEKLNWSSNSKFKIENKQILYTFECMQKYVNQPHMSEDPVIFIYYLFTEQDATLGHKKVTKESPLDTAPKRIKRGRKERSISGRMLS